MLFITYWELNEEMSHAERAQIMKKLTGSGLFPPSGVKIVRWDTTPDSWGILVADAPSPAAMYRAMTLWRTAAAGFFKTTKTAPAVPIHESMPISEDVVNELIEATDEQ
jgi:hypothetical protein